MGFRPAWCPHCKREVMQEEVYVTEGHAECCQHDRHKDCGSLIEDYNPGAYPSQRRAVLDALKGVE